MPTLKERLESCEEAGKAGILAEFFRRNELASRVFLLEEATYVGELKELTDFWSEQGLIPRNLDPELKEKTRRVLSSMEEVREQSISISNVDPRIMKLTYLGVTLMLEAAAAYLTIGSSRQEDFYFGCGLAILIPVAALGFRYFTRGDLERTILDAASKTDIYLERLSFEYRHLKL